MRIRVRKLVPYWVLSLALLATACHKSAVAPAPPAAAPSAAAPAAPGPPTCTLTAEPATIVMGHSATLSWTSENASEVTLNPTLGKQLTTGSTSVTPSGSTTYTLSLVGPAGKGQCEARITVSPPTLSSPQVKESNLPTAFSAGAELKDAFFDFNSAQLRPDAETALTKDASFLKAHPDMKIVVSGHCDQRGSEEYNLGLGQRRATAAKQFLVNLGVPSADVTTISYGKDRLYCTETTESCYQENRRAHVGVQTP